MNFLNFLSSGFNCKSLLTAVMGFHVTSQERLGSGLFRSSLPAVDLTKTPAEDMVAKPSTSPNKSGPVLAEPKETKEPIQPIIS